MELKKNIIALALVSVLSACGGSNSSPAVVDPIETVINGKAIKGTIANGIVTVFKFVNGLPVKLTPEELTTSDITTENNGSYTITVLDYDGPIKIELSVGENTTMICDAQSGCGDVAFGEAIELSTVDPEFTLSAISTVSVDSGAEVNVNVSALTHLAAELIEVKAAESGTANAVLVQEQSSAIANAFGIIGNITELEPTAVESAVTVAVEDNENELRYGLINSGVMSALFSGTTDATGVLSEKLAAAVTDIVENGGEFLVNQDDDEGFELAIVDVLSGAGEAAANLVEQFATDDTITPPEGIDLEQLETNLENTVVVADINANDDGRIAVVTDAFTEGGEVEKAKAMVEDIRLFSHIFEIGLDSNTAITTEGDLYLSLMDEAGVMVEAEAASFLLLADLADALSTISLQYKAGTITEGTLPINSFLSIDGAEGSITIDEETDDGGILFKVNAISGSDKVALNIAVVFAEDGLSLSLNIDGFIESTGALLTLSEGSFAKVNLDTTATRASLEDDTFEGEITSGELELTISLAQKTTDAVPNPVTFEGMVKTKLLPVIVHTLDEGEDWVINSDGSRVIGENYQLIYQTQYLKNVKTEILPEMLTLSGGFSSLEGNVVKATLTVNIQDLDSYEAPEFKYIGRSIDEAITVTVSEDKNTVTIDTSDMILNGSIETQVFTPGAVAGEWSLTVTTVWDSNVGYDDSSYTYDRKLVDTDGMTGYIYTSTYEDIVFIEHIVPTDTDDNGVADYYTYNAWFGEFIDSQGNLIDYNNNIVELIDDNSWNTDINNDLTELEEHHFLEPNSIENGAQRYAFMAQYIFNGNGYNIFVLELGKRAGVLFGENQDNFATIESGNSTSLSANITSSLPIEDAFKINISDDANVMTIEEGERTGKHTFNYISAGNFQLKREISDVGSNDIYTDIRDYSTNDIGLDVPEIILNRIIGDSTFTNYYLIHWTPVDTNEDGLSDYFTRTFLWSESVNNEGQLVDFDGNVLEGVPYYEFDSLDNADFDWHLPFNPLTVSNGLDAFKGWLTNVKQDLYSYVDNIGSIEKELTSDEVAANIYLFDGINTAPDSTDSLENEDVFLDANAALALEVVLGEYQVNLTLSGERTGLDDGKFDLAMSYKLPGESEQRSFVAHVNTKEEGIFSANNSEGVVLVLSELEEDSDSNVIGTIVVGTAAVEVAEIQDRDGLIVIVFSDGATESL